MDYLDPAKKRAHIIRLYIGYALIAVAIVFASLILLFQSYGYDINRRTGEVIQNGLVYVSAHPVPANVIVNGVNKGTTDQKLVIPADTYNFELQAKGYRSWKRKINLEGGSIEQIIYPFLFPSKLATKDQHTYDVIPQLATQSPDRRWLLVQPSGPLTHFDVFDLSDFKHVAESVVDLPSELLTPSSGPQSLESVEWSTDNKHILLKHTFGESTEYIIMDRTTPENSININKSLTVNPTNIVLRDKRFDRYYLYDAPSQTISTADLKTKQPKPLLTKVLYFKSFGPNTMLYVSDDIPGSANFSVKMWDGTKSYLIHTYPASGDYKLELASYSGTPYAVIVVSANNAAYIYKDPLAQAQNNQTPVPFIMLRINQPQFVSFSANTRFIALQSKNNFAVYDIDENRRFYFRLSENLAVDNKATWMDGHRLVAANNSQTEVFDFDGTNVQKLTTNTTGFTPFFDSNYTALYNIAPSINKTSDRQALTQTPLIVP